MGNQSKNVRSWHAETEWEGWVEQPHTGRKRENGRNTLFLQNWTGVLKVGVTIASFPVVAAPPAARGARDRFTSS